MYRHHQAGESKCRSAIAALAWPSVILAWLCGSSTLDPSPALADGSKIVAIFSSEFNADEDADSNGWPDAWSRVSDRDHPRYTVMKTEFRTEFDPVELQVARRTMSQWMLAWQLGKRPGDVIPEKTPQQLDRLLEATVLDRCLSIEMNGGSATIESPQFAIDRRFTYRVNADLKCVQLENYDASLNFIAVDAEGNQALLASTRAYSGNVDWTSLTLNNIQLGNAPYASAFLRLDVRAVNFRALFGKVSLDNVTVRRLPKLSVVVEPKDRVVVAGDKIDLACEITGLDRSEAKVKIVLKDIDDNVVHSEFRDVATEPANVNLNSPDQSAASQYFGTCKAQVTIPDAGMYRLAIKLVESGSDDFQQTNAIVALPQKRFLPSGRNPRFGLLVDSCGRSLSWNDTVTWVDRLGVGAVKLPIWFDLDKASIANSLAWMLDALNLRQIKVVGVLDRPPATKTKLFPGNSGEAVASALEHAIIWRPMLQPVWQQVCLHTQQFQIGWDDDLDFVANPRSPALVKTVREQATLFGPECSIAVPCSIFNSLIHRELPGNDKLTIQAMPGLTPTEIISLDQSIDRGIDRRWISVATLAGNDRSLASTVTDLCEKMIAVQQSRFPVGYFSRQTMRQVINDEGHPGDLMLPVKNIAAWLNGASQFEIVDLIETRKAVLFYSSSNTSLIIFPDVNSNEPIRAWIGDDVKASDVWGREFDLQRDRSVNGSPVLLPASQWPILLSNVDQSLIRWQRAFKLAIEDLVSSANLVADLPIQINNPEGFPASGQIFVSANELTREPNLRLPFAMQPNESNVFVMPVPVRSDLTEGEVPIGLVVKMESPRQFQFIVDESIHVGLPGIKIQSKRQLRGSDQLQIDVFIFNSTGSAASFDLTLYAPDQPRQKIQMLNVRETGQRSFLVEGASSFDGKSLRLGCEQIETGRTINHFVAP